jgi:hypothetical protein
MSGSMVGVGVGGVLPGMSIPGMFGSMVGVGVGVLPDMSIPGMSGSMVGVGVGAGLLPDMSMPAISSWLAGADAGELPDIFIPAIVEDIGLDVSMITPKTALATARRTAGMRVRRVRVQLVM